MKEELTYADITEDLCRHCAKCCIETLIPITLDERTYEYFKTVGLDIIRDPENPEVGILNAGVCRHLEKEDGKYQCGIYGTRPKLCADYNCVAWAKVSGEVSEIVQYALDVYNQINN